MNNGEVIVFNGLVELGSNAIAHIQPNGCRITDADIDAALVKFPEFVEVARHKHDCLLAVLDTNTGKTKRLAVSKAELPIEEFMQPNPHFIQFFQQVVKLSARLISMMTVWILKATQLNQRNCL